jgi:hypothetical protein
MNVMKQNNKITVLIMMVAAVGLLLQSCKKDNKESYPPSVITGAITYNGQPVGMPPTSNDLNSTNNTQHPLQLTQTAPLPLSGGYIKVFARNNGTFIINTFNGDYILQAVPGKNPFAEPPPVSFTLTGKATVNFPVTPYFWVSNYQTSFVDSVFTATFKLDKILNTYVDAQGATKNVALENVKVYFHSNSLADVSGKIFERTFTTVAHGVNVGGDCTIKVDLRGTQAAGNPFPFKGLTAAERRAMNATTRVLYANVAVKSNAATDALYQIPVLLGPK